MLMAERGDADGLWRDGLNGREEEGIEVFGVESMYFSGIFIGWSGRCVLVCTRPWITSDIGLYFSYSNHTQLTATILPVNCHLTHHPHPPHLTVTTQ